MIRISKCQHDKLIEQNCVQKINTRLKIGWNNRNKAKSVLGNFSIRDIFSYILNKKNKTYNTYWMKQKSQQKIKSSHRIFQNKIK